MSDTRSNILLIFPDQWRGDCLGWLGHPSMHTPCLDDLASRSVTFTRAYSNCPSCIAARASLLTGMVPHATGRLGYRDGVAWRYSHTLPQVLRDAGYQTLQVGKTHFHPQRAHLGFEQNELYDTQKLDPGFESDYERWLREQTGGRVVDTPVDMNTNSWLVHPWVHPEHLHPTCWTSTRAIELLARRDPQRPFFLMLGYHRPHPPLDPPLAWLERFRDLPLPPQPMGDWVGLFPGLDDPVVDLQAYAGRLSSRRLDEMRRAYFAQIAHLDFQIGRVLWWLNKYGKALWHTWIVFASDHGELLGDHGLLRKFNGFEGSARIPLIIRPPSGMQIAKSSRCSEPVGLHDLMPTLLEAAGVPIPDSVQGRSLLPLVRGEAPSPPWRSYVHGEHAGGHLKGGGCQFVVSSRWKYIWHTVSGRELMFDLDSDPNECRNLAASPEHAGQLQQCRRWLIEALVARPEDGLTDGNRLIPGRDLPPVRDWLLEARS